MSSILQKQVGIATAAVTLTTTTETQVAYSGRVEATYPTTRMVIKGWANVTQGGSTTALVARLRRGNGIAGTVVATATIFVTAANSPIEVNVWFAEQLLNIEFQDYSLTLQQTGAVANGTANLAQIEVETING